MLNRKSNKPHEAKSHRRNRERIVPKAPPVRRRFIISSKAAAISQTRAETRNGNGNGNGHAKISSQSKMPHPSVPQPPALNSQSPVDLTETIKTLLHLQQENGYVTYDDINDILPDGLSPDDLDELYTKLRSLDVEIVDQAEVERNKPAAAEEPDEDARLEILDDPVRMYMNQMGKVPLLTREQEVEICKKKSRRPNST